eukprot:6734123-Pyramimonas_sp.AAC.1
MAQQGIFCQVISGPCRRETRTQIWRHSREMPRCRVHLVQRCLSQEGDDALLRSSRSAARAG